MRYTLDEALRESLRRAAVRKKRRSRRITGSLSAAAVLLLGAVVTADLGLASYNRPMLEDSVYGAFLLPSEAGGYILAGVAAFAVGVLLTLLCVRYRDGERYRRSAAARRGGAERPDCPPDREGPGEACEKGPTIEADKHEHTTIQEEEKR